MSWERLIRAAYVAISWARSSPRRSCTMVASVAAAIAGCVVASTNPKRCSRRKLTARDEKTPGTFSSSLILSGA